ncbi:MAG: alpha/beta hydrolase [Solirubrobacterales bacterium]|nr:alpha/beta hydrolase [Solirubrobacterales bacterium]
MEASQTQHAEIPLILIHGAWLSARSWENYADYFANRGFAVSAPEWPRKQGDVEQMREGAAESAGLGVQEIVDHYAQLIHALDQPPLLIGHSYGGLFVELLLDRGLGRAGVAMSPAPPKGILTLPFSTLKSGAPALAHPSKWHGVVTLAPEEFTYAFANTFSEQDAAAAYDRYAVPETGQIFYEAGFANFHLHPPTEVHFKTRIERRCSSSAPERTIRCPPRSPGRNTTATSALRPEPTTSSSRVARTFTWSPQTGTRSPPRSTAGSTASSTRRG